MMWIFKAAKAGGRTAWDFFVRWFLPVPAVETIEEQDDADEESTEAKANPVVEDAPEEPEPIAPFEHPPEPNPTIRPPEGAEDRAARGSKPPGTTNPFEWGPPEL